MMRQSQRIEQKEVFASYHFTGLKPMEEGDLKGILPNGFGNYVGMFNVEAYNGSSMSKFIVDLEKAIKIYLEEQLGMEVQVKVLYFR